MACAGALCARSHAAGTALRCPEGASSLRKAWRSKWIKARKAKKLQNRGFGAGLGHEVLSLIAMEPMASIPMHTEPMGCYVRRLEYEARQACHWQQRFLDLEASHKELKAEFSCALGREQELRSKCSQLESQHVGKMALLEQLGSSRGLLEEKERQVLAKRTELAAKSQALEESAAYQRSLVSKLSELQARLNEALKAVQAREELAAQLRCELAAKDRELEKFRGERGHKEEEAERLRWAF